MLNGAMKTHFMIHRFMTAAKSLWIWDGWIALLQIQCLIQGEECRKAWRRNRKSIKTFWLHGLRDILLFCLLHDFHYYVSMLLSAQYFSGSTELSYLQVCFFQILEREFFAGTDLAFLPLFTIFYGFENTVIGFFK